MRHTLTALDFLAPIAARLGLPREALDDVFDGCPSDFPVIVAEGLPFGVHRAGMSGITLAGRVYVRRAVAERASAETIVLIRHEAEHVRQQRAERVLFYPRYGISWLITFLATIVRQNPFARGALSRAWYRAYRAIPAEREAYAAGDRARAILAARMA